jgi:hypothetical protein
MSVRKIRSFLTTYEDHLHSLKRARVAMAIHILNNATAQKRVTDTPKLANGTRDLSLGESLIYLEELAELYPSEFAEEL